MTYLVVGGGGREHTIIRKLKESPDVDKIYCTPGNGGISKDAEVFDVAATDVEGVVALAKKLAVDCVFVAPDDPLVMGMVDALEEEGIRAFGPNKKAAIIEGSKVFSKELMKKYGIPSAAYEVFNDPKEALDYIDGRNSYPTVIKADGLALGKGVVIAENFGEAKAAIHSIMEDKIFGNSGNNIVIEEFLTGPEVSVLAFTDGKCVRPMVSSMDHKRVFNGNLGPNTGGMGTISPNPFYTDGIAQECMDKIFLPTINAMNAEGRTFKGCLYFGLMLTPNGPKVIEYNSRFGDPEAQVVLPRLKTDFSKIVNAIIDEKLSDLDIEWDDGACACVIMASGGYGATVYHAGTKCSGFAGGGFLTNGGRVLGVTAKGANLDEALDKAYAAVDRIKFKGAHFRTDIGRAYKK